MLPRNQPYADGRRDGDGKRIRVLSNDIASSWGIMVTSIECYTKLWILVISYEYDSGVRVRT